MAKSKDAPQVSHPDHPQVLARILQQPPPFARRRSKLNKPIEEHRLEVQQVLAPRRLELIRAAGSWIRAHEEELLTKFADGRTLDVAHISPALEVCETAEQVALWRYVRFLGTIPYSDYVGRRIRFLIRDEGQPNRPVMGIAALGSTVLQCPPRDFAIGWKLPEDRAIKSEHLVSIMDLFVSIAAPPYNELTAGKLICYMMLSNEVRGLYASRYQGVPTRMAKRMNTELVLLNTTSLYAASAQYNRLRFRDQLAYIPVGYTSGYGNSHVSEQEFQDMIDYLRLHHCEPSHEWGAGSSWRLRVIRAYWRLRARELRYHTWIKEGRLPSTDEISGERLAENMLHHEHIRQVYIAPLASNWREYLQGLTEMPAYHDWPLEELIDHWKRHWAQRRLAGPAGSARIDEKVRTFSPQHIRLTPLLDHAGSPTPPRWPIIADAP